MTETQKRIKAYKKALPHMKERVFAVAVLFVVSISMMTSATFAWLTLSRSPEVSSLATTIATNGNLEIALSDTDGLQPDESAVGDGGQDVTLSNLTWGNLINLSDSRYGLDSLVLRPASLNTRDLVSSPVYAVNYGADGRVTNYITDFAFTNYEEVAAGKFAFTVPDTTRYGVRAVSSVTYEDIAGNAFLVTKLGDINIAFSGAQGLFRGIYQNGDYMDTVGSLVGVHVSYVLGEGDDVAVSGTDMEVLEEMARALYNCMRQIGTAITELMNLHQYLNMNDGDTYVAFTFKDLFEVNYDGTGTFSANNLNNAVLNAYDEWIPSISLYRTAWVNTVKAYNGIVEAGSKSVVYWKQDLMGSVNLLCDMNSATLNDDTAAELQADMVNKAAAIIMADEHTAVINGGVLKDADQLIDGNLAVDPGEVDIKVAIPQSIKDKLGALEGLLNLVAPGGVLTLQPDISTSAAPPATLDTDYKSANERASGGSNLRGQAIAADTYAMAVDFWVRTNVRNSLLILEGELQTEERPLLDAEGNPILDENGNELTETVVIGYSGVNRVWDELDDSDSDASMLIPEGATSTTQGVGSCYIFYASDPEQQAQSMNMLRAMRVAFVDDKGDLLAQAKMDVDNAVEDSGRIIVPLQLFEQPPVDMGDGTTETRYIQKMPQNVAQRITAIIYLDGSILTNSEVLDAGSIKGQLNIQFGTTEMNMDALEDSDLMGSYYTINFPQKEYDLGAYDEENSSITLRMSIAGTQPNTVKGNFLSIINETQGAREEEFTMTLGDDGYWTATVDFSGPGNYQLRSIQLDGVDIALDTNNIVKVEIDGIAVNSLSCTGWSGATHSVLTAESYYQQEMVLNLASSEIHSVRGVFIGDNGQNISVNFAYQNGLYHGTANFNASNTYRMTYLEIDGSITPLSEDMYKTITLQLGLRAHVSISEPVLVGGQINEDILKNVSYDGSGWRFTYTCEEPLTMDVRCIITDDQGNKIENLENVKIRYGVANSEANLLDANLTWTAVAGSYDGQFLFQDSGVYQFRYVIIDDTNFITTASSAPKLTSIPPTPMEYVEQAPYEELIYELGRTDRSLSITLKNASAASLDITLTNGDGTKHVVTGVTGTTDDAGITTFTVQAPSDGQWTITEAYASTVFYDGTFYSGITYKEDGTVDEDNRLPLTEWVVADNIGTYFLTEVNVAVTGAPSASYSGEFMADHEVNDMIISVTNQGKSLESILKSLGIENSDVSVSMTYTWDRNLTYTLGNGTLPAHDFGGALSEGADGAFAMGSMNFKLKGVYQPELTVTIGGAAYTIKSAKDAEASPLNIGAALTSFVTVNWAQLDVVTITAITPNGSNFAVDEKTSGSTADSSTTTGSGCDAETVYTTASEHKAAGSHSHVAEITNDGKTATVYIYCSGYSDPGDDHEAEPAEVTLALTAIEGVTAAELTFVKQGGGTVHMYRDYSSSLTNWDPDTANQSSSFVWNSGSGDCSRYIGDVGGSSSGSDSKTAAGELKSDSMKLTYNGVVYTIPYSGITINNPY